LSEPGGGFMAQGHVGFVLGHQSQLASMSGILDDSVESAGVSQAHEFNYNKDRIYKVKDLKKALRGFVSMCQTLIHHEIKVSFVVLGQTPSNSDFDVFLENFELNKDLCSLKSVESLQNQKLDAILYMPLDLKPSRLVEQMARLTMLCPKVDHVSVSPIPKWTHAPLMALKETWKWVNPFSLQSLESFTQVQIKDSGKEWDASAAVLFRELRKSSLIQKAPEIICRSHVLRELLNLIDAISDADSTILIHGDSGTGKELIARRIHERSQRNGSALIKVNCGAIPSDLLESELFGHVKGAFTGAFRDREGKFTAANGGTLFLDEISEMEPHLQVKLLRVLQEKTYEAVGSNTELYSDCRIIAATNKNLEELVAEGKFREDLFYRINVIPLHVPALRERAEDIPILVEHFIKKFNASKNRRVTGLTRSAFKCLAGYAWPGNIRELENLMERMVIIKSIGVIDALDFPDKYRRVQLSEIEYSDINKGSFGAAQRRAPYQNLNSERNGELYNMSNHNNNNNNNNNNNGYYPNGAPMQANNNNQGTNVSSNNGYSSNASYSNHPNNNASNNGAAAGATSGMSYSQETSMGIQDFLSMLKENFKFPEEGIDFNDIVNQFENILILSALANTGWNRNRAAGLLRLNRTTLVEKLKKKGLTPPPKGGFVPSPGMNG